MVKSILDPTFKYTNAANTDIRATFRRIRKEQAEAVAAAVAEQATKVQPIRKVRP